MTTPRTVTAKKVREGDFLPGIDHAYVWTEPERAEYETTIRFHDANGDDGTLTLPHKSRVTIERARWPK